MKIYEEPVLIVLTMENEDILTLSDNFASDIFFEKKDL